MHKFVRKRRFCWILIRLICKGFFFKNLCKKKKIVFKVWKWSLTDLVLLFYSHRNLNKLSIKYQSYSKSVKIDAFEQKIYTLATPLILIITTFIQPWFREQNFYYGGKILFGISHVILILKMYLNI